MVKLNPKYLVPYWGLKKFGEENPTNPHEYDLESKNIVVGASFLYVYNCLACAGAIMGTIIGLEKIIN